MVMITGDKKWRFRAFTHHHYLITISHHQYSSPVFRIDTATIHVKSRYSEVASYLTRDGCEIRELMHPAVHGNRNQSLAEATVNPGQNTALHLHRTSEEIYYFSHGSGVMTVGDQTFSVMAGDTVCIPPGTPHRVENTGDRPLRIVCACSPPYSHDDTELV